MLVLFYKNKFMYSITILFVWFSTDIHGKLSDIYTIPTALIKKQSSRDKWN